MTHVHLPPLFACAMSLALAGCLGSSRPSRFYTLSPEPFVLQELFQ